MEELEEYIIAIGPTIAMTLQAGMIRIFEIFSLMRFYTFSNYQEHERR